MPNDDVMFPKPARSASSAPFGRGASRGPVIDQDGREIPSGSFGGRFQGQGFQGQGSQGQGSQGQGGGFQGGGFQGFRFDFGQSGANPFGNLTREQRLARLDGLAKLLDVAFVLPGTNIRYGIDGIIRLVPVVGDLIASAFSLWLVREARALGAPWHVTSRMLANVALEGAVGMIPVAGDAFDVMFRANMRNMRILRNWMDRQPR